MGTRALPIKPIRSNLIRSFLKSRKTYSSAVTTSSTSCLTRRWPKFSERRNFGVSPCPNTLAPICFNLTEVPNPPPSKKWSNLPPRLNLQPKLPLKKPKRKNLMKMKPVMALKRHPLPLRKWPKRCLKKAAKEESEEDDADDGSDDAKDDSDDAAEESDD